MKLYEIANEFKELNELEDIPAEQLADTLDLIQGNFNDKAVNVVAFIQNLAADAKAIKEAEDNMARRRRSIENRVHSMKDYLRHHMEKTGITKIECPYFKISLAKTAGRVVINNPNAIPRKYKTLVKETRIDKNLIKEDLKKGAVRGAFLEAGTSLRIK